MSKLIRILLFFLTITSAASARNGQTSVLEIKLDDGSPLVVSINGRNYNKHGRNLTIGDLPRGRHDLRVYEYLEYKKGGGKAKLIYSGRIKVAAGTINYCEVNARTGNMRVRTMDLAAANIAPTGNASPAGSSKVWQPGGQLTTQQMDDLELNIEAHETDIDKLKLMKSSLEGKKLLTSQVRNMANWLAFEDSRLDFVKWSYKNTTDKAEYSKLQDLFSMEANKKEFKEIGK